MSNKYIVPIGILIVAILVIGGGFLILNPYQPSPPSNTNGDNFIEPTSVFIPDIKIHAGELKKTTDLQLMVGDEYKYEYKFASPLNLTGGDTKMSGSTDITVDRKERYNKKDVFVLKYVSKVKYENLGEEEINMSGAVTIDKDGRIIASISRSSDVQEISLGDNENDGGRPFSSYVVAMDFKPDIIVQPWMLALSENFEWNKNMTMAGKIASSERYRVIGVEEIDTKDGKKKCYKVEEESIIRADMLGTEVATNNKISERATLWIDYNKRILVKAESWIENLKIGSIELVDEK